MLFLSLIHFLVSFGIFFSDLMSNEVDIFKVGLWKFVCINVQQESERASKHKLPLALDLATHLKKRQMELGKIVMSFPCSSGNFQSKKVKGRNGDMMSLSPISTFKCFGNTKNQADLEVARSVAKPWLEREKSRGRLWVDNSTFWESLLESFSWQLKDFKEIWGLLGIRAKLGLLDEELNEELFSCFFSYDCVEPLGGRPPQRSLLAGPPLFARLVEVVLEFRLVVS